MRLSRGPNSTSWRLLHIIFVLLIRHQFASSTVTLSVTEGSSVYIKTNVKMICESSSGKIRRNETQFFKDDLPITEDSNSSTSTQGSAVALLLVDVSTTDSGSYKCSTSVGTSPSVLLSVYGDPVLWVPPLVISYGGNTAIIPIQVENKGNDAVVIFVTREGAVVSKRSEAILGSGNTSLTVPAANQTNGTYQVEWSLSSRQGKIPFVLLVKKRLDPPTNIKATPTSAFSFAVHFSYREQSIRSHDTLQYFLLRVWSKDVNNKSTTNITAKLKSDQRSTEINVPKISCARFLMQIWTVGDYTTSKESNTITLNTGKEPTRLWDKNGTVYFRNRNQAGALKFRGALTRADKLCTQLENTFEAESLNESIERINNKKCYSFPNDIWNQNQTLNRLLSQCRNFSETDCSTGGSHMLASLCPHSTDTTKPPEKDDTGLSAATIAGTVSGAVFFVVGAVVVAVVCCYLKKKKISRGSLSKEEKTKALNSPESSTHLRLHTPSRPMSGTSEESFRETPMDLITDGEDGTGGVSSAQNQNDSLVNSENDGTPEKAKLIQSDKTGRTSQPKSQSEEDASSSTSRDVSLKNEIRDLRKEMKGGFNEMRKEFQAGQRNILASLCENQDFLAAVISLPDHLSINKKELQTPDYQEFASSIRSHLQQIEHRQHLNALQTQEAFRRAAEQQEEGSRLREMVENFVVKMENREYQDNSSSEDENTHLFTEMVGSLSSSVPTIDST